MDSKYGRLFTQTDVETIVELLDPNGFDAASVQAAIDELGSQAQFPADEPLFLLRGQDRYALSGIMTYRDSCSNSPTIAPTHMENVDTAIDTFRQYATDNYTTMKEPD